MSIIYEWVKNIVYFYIFITVINHVLPHKKYEKFIRLFSGLILILLVISPITKGLRLEDQLAHYFEEYSFQNDVGDFKKELLGIETQRVNQMIGQYEQAIAMDLEKMALDSGFYPIQTKVTIEQDKDNQQFAAVKAIAMTVSADPVEPSGITAVDPVLIEIGDPEEEPKRDFQEEQTALNVLRRKIESYYGLEASYVEIQMEQG